MPMPETETITVPASVTEPVTVVHGDAKADQVGVWRGAEADAATTYRLLQPDEWDRVAPIFERYGSRMPPPQVASIAVAERDGEIIGFLTLQPMLHVEPVWVAENRTKDVYIPRMLGVLESLLQPLLPEGQAVDLYVFSGQASTGRLAKAHGFTHTPYHVWKKRLSGGE